MLGLLCICSTSRVMELADRALYAEEMQLKGDGASVCRVRARRSKVLGVVSV